MVFSSILFLFWFLPITFIIYFISPKKYRNLVLLLCSLYFYAWGEPKYIPIMILSTVLDFTVGNQIVKAQSQSKLRQAKAWLLVSVVVNLSFLIFFKYSNFIIENLNTLFSLQIASLNIKLPIGISFYTFQTMSYSIDIYRKQATAQRNIFDFATYVTLFPQLIAGPIVRYQDIASELTERQSTTGNISDGITRFVIGLAKKVLLANNIGLLWESIITNTYAPSVVLAWLGIISFAFQIYFDFSGYSDMAIGLGKIFGFNFPENFNYPYMSKSITEFWRRWHITLGTWFKEYVYIPLGGNRVSKPLQIRNILIVWLLTGVWHGASWNFVLWGLFFAMILLIERMILKDTLAKLPALVSTIYTLFLVLISWVIFAFDSLQEGLSFLGMMFAWNDLVFINTDTLYLLSTHFVLLLILALASTNIIKHKRLRALTNNKLISTLSLIFLLLICIAYLVDSTYNPFLYFRF